MWRVVAILAVLMLAAAPQDDGSKPDCCVKGVPKKWDDYNKGVKWTQSIDAAVAKAKKEGRILMVFHLVGDMDKQGC